MFSVAIYKINGGLLLFIVKMFISVTSSIAAENEYFSKFRLTSTVFVAVLIPVGSWFQIRRACSHGEGTFATFESCLSNEVVVVCWRSGWKLNQAQMKSPRSIGAFPVTVTRPDGRADKNWYWILSLNGNDCRDLNGLLITDESGSSVLD